MNLNSRFVQLMEIKNVNPSELADKWNVSKQQISNITTGRNKIGIKILHKIIDFFPDLNLNWLIKGEGDIWEKEFNDLELRNNELLDKIELLQSRLEDKENHLKSKDEIIELLKEQNQNRVG